MTLIRWDEIAFLRVEEVEASTEGPRRSKHYDQIALHTSARQPAKIGRAGAFEPCGIVYRDDEEATYRDMMGEAYATQETDEAKRKHYEGWRVMQMSERLLMWAEIDLDPERRHLSGGLARAAAEGEMDEVLAGLTPGSSASAAWLASLRLSGIRGGRRHE